MPAFLVVAGGDAFGDVQQAKGEEAPIPAVKKIARIHAMRQFDPLIAGSANGG